MWTVVLFAWQMVLIVLAGMISLAIIVIPTALAWFFFVEEIYPEAINALHKLHMLRLNHLNEIANKEAQLQSWDLYK